MQDKSPSKANSDALRSTSFDLISSRCRGLESQCGKRYINENGASGDDLFHLFHSLAIRAAFLCVAFRFDLLVFVFFFSPFCSLQIFENVH